MEELATKLLSLLGRWELRHCSDWRKVCRDPQRSAEDFVHSLHYLDVGRYHDPVAKVVTATHLFKSQWVFKGLLKLSESVAFTLHMFRIGQSFFTMAQYFYSHLL